MNQPDLQKQQNKTSVACVGTGMLLIFPLFTILFFYYDPFNLKFK